MYSWRNSKEANHYYPVSRYVLLEVLEPSLSSGSRLTSCGGGGSHRQAKVHCLHVRLRQAVPLGRVEFGRSLFVRFKEGIGSGRHKTKGARGVRRISRHRVGRLVEVSPGWCRVEVISWSPTAAVDRSPLTTDRGSSDRRLWIVVVVADHPKVVEVVALHRTKRYRVAGPVNNNVLRGDVCCRACSSFVCSCSLQSEVEGDGYGTHNHNEQHEDRERCNQRLFCTTVAGASTCRCTRIDNLPTAIRVHGGWSGRRRRHGSRFERHRIGWARAGRRRYQSRERWAGRGGGTRHWCHS
jgi:hypothetical protein